MKKQLKCSVLLLCLSGQILSGAGSVWAVSAPHIIDGGLQYIDASDHYVLDCAADTSVTSVHIPAEINGKPVLVNGAHFRSCPNLKEITVDEAQKTVSAKDGVLFSKNGSILIEYPCAKAGAYSLPETVSAIADRAFENAAGLTEITLADSLQNVGNSAFVNCTALQEIHGAVPYTYGTVFNGCTNLRALKLAETGDASGSVNLTNFTLIDCTALESVTIPDCRVLAADVTIRNCPKLKAIHFPELEDTDGEPYFTVAGCDALTELELPAVRSRSEGAFYSVTNCPNLSTVIFREGKLAGAEIQDCPALTKAIYFTGEQNRNPSRFTGCDALTVYGLSSDIQLRNDCEQQNIPFMALDQMPGDVNTDTETDVRDAVLLSRFLAEDADAVLSQIGKKNADMDGDGERTTNDVTVLLRKIAKLE